MWTIWRMVSFANARAGAPEGPVACGAAAQVATHDGRESVPSSLPVTVVAQTAVAATATQMRALFMGPPRLRASCARHGAEGRTRGGAPVDPLWSHAIQPSDDQILPVYWLGSPSCSRTTAPCRLS